MPRGVLFIGGLSPKPDWTSRIIREDDLVCAADSGLDSAMSAGIRPHGVVGDMDSLSDPSLLEDFPPGRVIIAPEDKDETDTELGLAWLRDQGARPLVIIGGGEGRLDHTLALMKLFDASDPPSALYTALEEIRPVEGRFGIEGREGDTISFFPVGTGPWEVRSSGLQWSLDDLAWSSGAVSLSNRLLGERASLDVTRGRILTLRPLDEVPTIRP